MIRDRSILIRDAEPHDARLMVHVLRQEDREEVTCLGLRPLRTLRRSYERSVIRRTAFVGNDIAAMWGMGGSLLSPIGEPWLLTSAAVEEKPLAFAKQIKREVQEMLQIKPMLRGYVAASYVRAIRLLALVGFEIGEPEPFGASGALFCLYSLGGKT